MNKAKVEKVLLTLSPEDRAEWIAYYSTKKERLQNELAEVQRNLAELKGESSSEQYKLPLSYNKDGNWPQKLEYVLDQFGRNLPAPEIVSELAKLEGVELSNEFKNRVNVAIQYQLKNNGILSKIEVDVKSLIGLKKWSGDKIVISSGAVSLKTLLSRQG
jgi:hypothetical protein